MARLFGTQDWADALAAEINRSSEYRNAGARWGVEFNGNMIFAFAADADLAQSLHLLIRLQGGSCQGSEFIPEESHPEADFVLRAPFSLWREILAGRTLAATAILTGKLKVKGNKMTLLKHAAAHRALIHCTSTVETTFP